MIWINIEKEIEDIKNMLVMIKYSLKTEIYYFLKINSRNNFIYNN